MRVPLTRKKSSLYSLFSVAMACVFSATNVAAIPGGVVRHVSLPSGPSSLKTVFYMQDVHMNAEAQINISRAVQSLILQKKIDLIALEGACDPIHLDGLRSADASPSVKKVADYLLRVNRISGPVHAALIAPSFLPAVIGIDDKPHYDANVSAYRRSVSAIPSLKKRLRELSAELEDRKFRSFTGPMASLDGLVRNYRRGKIKTDDYLAQLSERTASVPAEVRRFLAARRLERSLDYEQVEIERNDVVRRLLPRLTPKEAADFFGLGEDYRAGYKNHAEFYRRLQALAVQKGITGRPYPALSAYMEYTQTADRLEEETLYAGSRLLEEAAWGSLKLNDDQKEVVESSRRLFLIGKLLDFSLTRWEWDEYKVLTDDPRARSRRLDLSSFERFYCEAEARDALMVANLLKEMESRGSRSAVLVTGGFHWSGVHRLLAEAGVTTVTFVPALSRVSDGAGYLNAFRLEKTTLEKFFDGEKLTVAFSPGAGIKDAPFILTAIEPSQRVLEISAGGNFELVASRREPARGPRPARRSADFRNRKTTDLVRVHVEEDGNKILNAKTLVESQSSLTLSATYEAAADQGWDALYPQGRRAIERWFSARFEFFDSFTFSFLARHPRSVAMVFATVHIVTAAFSFSPFLLPPLWCQAMVLFVIAVYVVLALVAESRKPAPVFSNQRFWLMGTVASLGVIGAVFIPPAIFSTAFMIAGPSSWVLSAALAQIPAVRNRDPGWLRHFLIASYAPHWTSHTLLNFIFRSDGIIESALPNGEVAGLRTSAIEFLNEAVRVLESVVEEYNQVDGVPMERKKDRTLVSKADKAIQQKILELLRRKYPGHYLLGEEKISSSEATANQENAESDFVWILDPLDGTRPFLQGKPTFAIPLALYYKGRPVVAAVWLPEKGILMAAQDRVGVQLNNAPVQAENTSVDSPLRATVAGFSEDREMLRQSIDPSALQPWDQSSVYEITKIILGESDFYSYIAEPRLTCHVWDVAAIGYILEKAGGTFLLVKDGRARRGLDVLADDVVNPVKRGGAYNVVAANRKWFFKLKDALRRIKGKIGAAGVAHLYRKFLDAGPLVSQRGFLTDGLEQAPIPKSANAFFQGLLGRYHFPNGLIPINFIADGAAEKEYADFVIEHPDLAYHFFLTSSWSLSSVVSLEDSMKETLRRLGHVDLLFIEEPTAGDFDPLGKTLVFIQELKSRKAVSQVGFSIRQAEDLAEVLKKGLIKKETMDVVKLPISLFLSRSDLVSRIRAEGVGIVLQGNSESEGIEMNQLLLGPARSEFEFVLTGGQNPLIEPLRPADLNSLEGPNARSSDERRLLDGGPDSNKLKNRRLRGFWPAISTSRRQA